MIENQLFGQNFNGEIRSLVAESCKAKLFLEKKPFGWERFYTNLSLVFAESVTQTRLVFRRTSILPTLLSKSTSPTVTCR